MTKAAMLSNKRKVVVLILLFLVLVLSIGCYSMSEEQRTLSAFVGCMESGNLDEALKYCWNARIVDIGAGVKAISFDSAMPMVKPPHGVDPNDWHPILYPNSLRRQDIQNINAWRIVRKSNKEDDIGNSIKGLINPPPGYYVMVTSREVALGFVRIEGKPKLCFTYLLRG